MLLQCQVSPTTKNYLAPNVAGAETEKPCLGSFRGEGWMYVFKQRPHWLPPAPAAFTPVKMATFS